MSNKANRHWTMNRSPMAVFAALNYKKMLSNKFVFSKHLTKGKSVR